MVSDRLLENCRAMAELFPEENGIDASDNVVNESKSRKKDKKKRSGSFQGILILKFPQLYRTLWLLCD